MPLDGPESPGEPTIVPGQGSLPSLGFVLGEAPGRLEVKKRAPFVGPSGQALDQAFSLLGISRAELYITNACKTLPLDGSGQIRRPTMLELHYWQGTLRAELDACRPAAILLLGKTAAEQWGYTPDLVRQDIYAAWHPAYLLRSTGEEKWQQWLFQISPFVRAIRSAERLRARA